MPSYNQIVLHMPVVRRTTQCGYGGVGLVLFINCERSYTQLLQGGQQQLNMDLVLQIS